MKLLTYLRELRRSFSGYQPLIEVLIYKDRILHNLRTFQKKYPNYQLAPVLKSNAYGHGLFPVAKILDDQNIAFLTVDSIFEAIMLRKEGIKSKILVIGYTKPEDISRNYYKNISFTLTNYRQLLEVSKKLRRKQAFHLKIDTGMHRQGILSSEIKNSIAKIKGNRKIILEGICSHFALADSTDTKYSEIQIKNWDEAVEKFKEAFSCIKYFHLAATGGSYYCRNTACRIPTETNVIRLGLGLYGIDPSPNRKLDLKPALELRTVIGGIKIIRKDELIGYGLTFKADKKMKVATVPAGYYEGVDRRLSNKGYYKIDRKFCPILGRVSMNISVVDVSKITNLKVGHPVTLISNFKKDANSAWNIAGLCDTIPYEILVHIPQHLRRTIV